MTRIGIIALALALAGCGGRTALAPKAGDAPPPKPAAAATAPTPDQLMTPTTQSRPERNDELLRRSEERQDDHFDLPPPG
ncbi:MAG: hypothetical protein ABS87_05385 [Sphingomonas sp. SCN 67-18]|uniref:hypothetical protein n=1 Tax=uncultured Sphingomonas sp. TaxID=158754 RepID=UPI00086A8D89|nr:hypothetical protein [Sphingomonas sp. SCN 67-18]ODU21785.1 MAG: hypothetical protein ABS87_05385 [Sphingomonas sp. SCN 67-18]